MRSSCQRARRIRPSSTCRLSRRAFARSKPDSSRSSEIMQHARVEALARLASSRSGMVLLLAERDPQPLLGELRAQQPARGQRAGEQHVPALIIHLDDELFARRPDLDLVLLREGQPQVERVAALLLLDLDRPLLEEE